MPEPVIDSYARCTVYGEDEYKIRVTHGAGTVSTIRAREVVVTRPSATTLVLTFPKPYAEVTDLNVGWQRASGAASIDYQITSNLIDTTGVVTLTCLAMNTAGTPTAATAGDVAFITMAVSADILNDRYIQTTA